MHFSLQDQSENGKYFQMIFKLGCFIIQQHYLLYTRSSKSNFVGNVSYVVVQFSVHFYTFFNVGPSKENIFFHLLLYSIFQSSLHILQNTIFDLQPFRPGPIKGSVPGCQLAPWSRMLHQLRRTQVLRSSIQIRI